MYRSLGDVQAGAAPGIVLIALVGPTAVEIGPAAHRVVRRIVEAAKRENSGAIGELLRVVGARVVALGRASEQSFAGVIVDDVEEDFQPGLVKGAHHVLELADGAPGRTVRRVAAVRGEESEGHVAPVIVAAWIPVVVLLAGELMYGQELDGGDAEIAQVACLQAGAAERAAEQLRDRGVLLGQAAYVNLVDDVIGEGAIRLRTRRRVHRPERKHALRRDTTRIDRAKAPTGVVVGDVLVGIDERQPWRRVVADLESVGIDEQLVRVESVACLVDIG